MDRAKQVALLTNFLDSIRADLVGKIEAGKVPGEWDGHELREWVADTCQHERTSLMRSDRKRRARYQTARIGNNL